MLPQNHVGSNNHNYLVASTNNAGFFLQQNLKNTANFFLNVLDWTVVS